VRQIEENAGFVRVGQGNHCNLQVWASWARQKYRKNAGFVLLGQGKHRKLHLDLQDKIPQKCRFCAPEARKTP
jgi:hypothetical protein